MNNREIDDFEIKDSGERKQFTSGMQRDTAENKIDPSLIYDGPMFERWMEHMRKGAIKYDKQNWMKANSQPELDRFRESAFRHFIQWFRGDRDEDHAAAVFFNINGAEYVKVELIFREAGLAEKLDKILPPFHKAKAEYV